MAVGLLMVSACATAGGSATTERVDVIRDPQAREWRAEGCPVGGDTSLTWFDPRTPRDDEILDVDPLEGWLGFEVVRAADLVLPDGMILETGGEYLGSDGYSTAVKVAEPGTYPYFFLLSAYEGHEGRPALAQLVLDAEATPVRWEADDRFGFTTDGGIGYLGSPDAVPLADGEFDEEVFWWFLDFSADDAEEPICWQYRYDGGSNFVVFSNGYGDGGFPGAVGYDSDGEAVAITWFFGWESWILAGIPGEPPAPITEMVECRQRLVAAGMPYPDTAWCPEG